jgi:hypothetical protein
MLWHVYAHAFVINVLRPGIRLVSLADLVHLTEAWVDELDWPRMRRTYGRAFRALPLLRYVTVLSPRVLARLHADHEVIAGGIRPVSSSVTWTGALSRDTLWPPDWWFRVRYGIRGQAAWLWYRLAGHPVHVIIAGFQTAIRRLRKRWSGKMPKAIRQRAQNWVTMPSNARSVISRSIFGRPTTSAAMSTSVEAGVVDCRNGSGRQGPRTGVM